MLLRTTKTTETLHTQSTENTVQKIHVFFDHVWHVDKAWCTAYHTSTLGTPCKVNILQIHDISIQDLC